MIVQFPFVRRLTARTRRHREPTPLLVRDWVEVDIPELSGIEAPVASVASDRAWAAYGQKELPEKITRWHDGAHWGVLDPLGADSPAPLATDAMTSRLARTLYDKKTLAAWKAGKLVDASTVFTDIQEDREEEDRANAVDAILAKFRVVDGQPVFLCAEPLLSVRVDTRSQAGQNRGFSPWFAVEPVLANGIEPKASEMLFRFDQIDNMRPLFGEEAGIRNLENASTSVVFEQEGTHVHDVWTASAVSHLRRRMEVLSVELRGKRPGYMDTWQSLVAILDGDHAEQAITEAFEIVAALQAQNPDSYDTRWLTKSSHDLFVAHWESRPIGLDLNAKAGAGPSP